MAATPHTLRHGTGALTVSPGFYPSPDRTRLLGLSLTVGREQPHPGDRTLPRRKQTSLIWLGSADVRQEQAPPFDLPLKHRDNSHEIRLRWQLQLLPGATATNRAKG